MLVPTVLTALIAARLYRINGNQEDLDWAVNIYKWERENLFNPATGASMIM